MPDVTQNIVLKGEYYAPGSSSRSLATLETDGTGNSAKAYLKNEAGVQVIQIWASDLSIDAPIGTAPRRITLPNQGVFLTADHDTVQRLSGDTHGSRLHAWEAFRPRLIGVMGVCAVAGWLFWRYGLDMMAGAAVAMTPQTLIDSLDRGTMLTIDKTVASPSKLSDEERARVSGIFTDLIAALPPEDAEGFTLEFRSLGMMGPNAFALPGGTVVMSDQLVNRFKGDDVVAGVLGHELGHAVEQHGLRQVYRSLGIFVVIGLMAGDTGPILEDILLEGNLLLSLAYSRKHETSADAFGVALVSRAGYNPTGLMEFFDTLKDEIGGGPGWASTHPAPEDRVKNIDALIEALE